MAIFLVVMYYCRSCYMYTAMTHLSDNDIKWYNNGIASNGTIFYTITGEKATLIIIRKNKENHANPFRWSYGYILDEYEAYGYYTYKLSMTEDSIKGHFSISKLLGYDTPMVRAKLNDFHTFSGVNRGILDGYLPLKTDTVHIDGVVLDDCMVFDSSNSVYDDDDTCSVRRIDKYIISKQHGLVYYRFEDGTYYSRRFKQ